MNEIIAVGVFVGLVVGGLYSWHILVMMDIKDETT